MRTIAGFSLILIISFFYAEGLTAQADSRLQGFKTAPSFSFQPGVQSGMIIQTNRFIRGDNAKGKPMWYYDAVYFKMAFQTSGKKDWQQLYQYPTVGFGFYAANFHNAQELGYPMAAFGFINIPLDFSNSFFTFLNKRTCFFEFGGGFAFNWKHYSPTNLYNISFGSPVTVYMDFALLTEFKLSQNTILQLGASSTHFSTGALKMPNHGITTFAPKAVLKFNSAKTKHLYVHQLPKFEKSREFEISILGGTKNVLCDLPEANYDQKFTGKYYPIAGITAVYYKTRSRKTKLGGGFNITYNAAANLKYFWVNNEIIENNLSYQYKTQASIFGSYELSINKVSTFIQPSVYIYRKKTIDRTSMFYARAGLQYYILKNVFIGVNLKVVDGFFPDYLEWDIGIGRLKF